MIRMFSYLLQTHVAHFQLAAAFAGAVYPPLRWLEIRYMGR